MATKGATSLTTGNKSIALNSNVATRIDAIAAKAVFDAVNALDHLSAKGYYYNDKASITGLTASSASAAATQAAHDVLFGTLPTAATWNDTRTWLDNRLAADLTALKVAATDPGIVVSKAAAVAALAARVGDFSEIRTTYTPSSNLSINTAVTLNTVVANATSNRGAARKASRRVSAGLGRMRYCNT